MRALRALPVALAFVAMPGAPCAPQSTDMLDKIVAQEQAEIESLRQYSPVVETYIQIRRPDKQVGVAPGGDKYFLGHALLAKGVELIPLAKDTRSKHNKLVGSLANFFSMEFVTRGFLQMIYVDMNGFDREHYEFSYIRREFLGEVRCLVFDVGPRVKSEKGRFVGRIWVEDQDFHIVRFNGVYNGSATFSHYFSFDSWRENGGKNQWLPAVIFCEEGNVEYPVTKKQIFPAFRAQTRLWGYALSGVPKEQELSRVLVEAPVADQTKDANDYSPLQAERTWARQAEDNVIESLERLGLMTPSGEVDKILEGVLNNLEVSNGLDIQPQVRCRVLVTSTFESYAIGHTIVLSRGLLDVLPDEASLAAIQKGAELLMRSPYKDQLTTAERFLQDLQRRSKEIPNLISPHLGDSILANWTIATGATSAQESTGKTANGLTAASVVALPLGGRIKLEPFDGQLHLLKFRAAGPAAEYEKMPFEVTPVVLYLTRQDGAPTQKAAEQPARSDP